MRLRRFTRFLIGFPAPPAAIRVENVLASDCHCNDDVIPTTFECSGGISLLASNGLQSPFRVA